MREGVYRLFRNYIDDHGKTQRRQVARFIFYGETLSGLEDHDGVLESLAPNYHVTNETLMRLRSMQQSPYWDLVREEDIQAGEHEHLLPEMQDGGPGAWPEPKE